MTPQDQDRVARALLSGLPRWEPSSAFRRRLLAATRAEWPTPMRLRERTGVRSALAGSARGVVAAGGGTAGEVWSGVWIAAAALTRAPVALLVVAFVLDAGVVVKGLARGCVVLVEWLSA